MPVGCAKLLKVAAYTPKRVAIAIGGLSAPYTMTNSIRRLQGGTWDEEFVETAPAFDPTANATSPYDLGFAGAVMKRTIFFASMSALRESIPDPLYSTLRMGKRSTDGGATWSDVTELMIPWANPGGADTPIFSFWSSLARRPSDDFLVMCGAAGSAGLGHAGSAIVTSADRGASWQQTTSIETATGLPNDGSTLISNVIYAKELGKFFAVGGEASVFVPDATAIWESADGISWTINHYIPEIGDGVHGFGLKGIGWDGATLIAWGHERYSSVTYKYAIRSTNGGTSWSDMGLRAQGLTGNGHDWAKVVGNGQGVWVAAEASVLSPWTTGASGGGALLYSTDNGATWEFVASQTTAICSDLVYSRGRFWVTRGGFMAAVGSTPRDILTSADGASWSTSEAFPSGRRPHAFAF